MPDPPRTGRELSPWLSLGLPVLIAAASFGIRSFDAELYERWMRSEFGLVENATVLFLAIAVALGIAIARRSSAAPWLRGWALLGAVGCFYFAGEEISWGYHVLVRLGFEEWLPAGWVAANDQGETNFHNLDGWKAVVFDQGPRSLLTAGALVGGIAVPLWERARGRSLAGVLGWLFPTLACLPAAALAVGITLPRRIARRLDVDALDVRMGETKECLLALFLLIYLASLRARARSADAAEP